MDAARGPLSQRRRMNRRASAVPCRCWCVVVAMGNGCC